MKKHESHRRDAAKLTSSQLKKITTDFQAVKLSNEDDVKINFYASIVKPLMRILRPGKAFDYRSENVLRAGGRTDATFQEISFEFKRPNYFRTEKGRNEALYGRDEKDHGLYDYLISHSGIESLDDVPTATKKLADGIGVGFDGKKFIFARFAFAPHGDIIRANKVKVHLPNDLRMHFVYDVMDFDSGLRRLALLVRQQDKIALTKQNVLKIINPRDAFVRDSIMEIYDELTWHLKMPNGSSRVKTLYREWDRVFGIMYGNDADATDFTEVSSAIREMYGLSRGISLDSKVYLFSLQTFFNMFLKLLIHAFLSQLVDPTFTVRKELSKADIDRLFDGEMSGKTNVIANFFESHFLEWFTFTSRCFEVKIVNRILREVDGFDLASFMLKPENVQDILQEVYMELIPPEMRHLMGEYFSPDWIVEHALDMIGYSGDINKSLIDPTAGSGPFLTQALKRIVLAKNGKLTRSDIEKVIRNIVGFDINPISVVSAKANYILILMSAFYAQGKVDFGEPISIPIFIADSILAPVVYAEENGDSLRLKTSVGDLVLPKFSDFKHGNMFLSRLSHDIHEKAKYKNFINYVTAKKLVRKEDEPIVQTLFDRLYVLHRAGHDSFWPIILRNSYAPIMIGDKFDYIVGNPPWIAWKSMSKSYREGTLKIWQSYGIFEKNAYDKKTTHDDFGMAVTYVAVDQYLKEGGAMVFLLPASFLKSTKGGEGFRKFRIIRNGQDMPFCVDAVHDFSSVNLFTIATSAVKFIKGREMSYPMRAYRKYIQMAGRKKIDSHQNWSQVEALLKWKDYEAQPVDRRDKQSAWLTLDNMTFANKVLSRDVPRYYSGRKGIEPAGAKGVYILKKPVRVNDGLLRIENDISRQRREDVLAKGVNVGCVEEDVIYPMLGGRNIAKWRVKSNEFMIVPHTATEKYGISEADLAARYPDAFAWLDFYHDELLASRIRNGKFFNPEANPFYRLDNVGPYTFAPYKVLWKEQSGRMAAVVVGSYKQSIPNADPDLFTSDKPIVVDSKVLMLGLDEELEAYFVCGIINSESVSHIIDGYAIGTNRGVDVLKYVAVPKYDCGCDLHVKIACKSKEIHENARRNCAIEGMESELDALVVEVFK